jgi:tetratricopeptide (TPR) repeat protein/transcriptional regulator with XRE-family HTH domain
MNDGRMDDGRMDDGRIDTVAGADVGILLRRHRRAAGLSIEALAEASGVSVRAIGDMERGRARGPQARTMVALADGLRLAGDSRAELLTAARDGRLHRLPDLPGVCDLPPDVPDFVGRELELAQLARLHDRATRSALVVLSGSGGLGKSALAVHAARRVAPGYLGGVLHVDLHGLDRSPMEPAEALGRLLQALGMRDLPAAVDDRAAIYRRLLAERDVLVVLDDARAEAQVRPLLAGAGASTVLVTSRRLLTGLAHARRIALAPLGNDDAVALLAAAGGVTRDAADLAAVARLCGNYPLALRIAGNRLLTRPSWTAADLAARLGDGERRLDQLVAGDLQVAAALALSYEQLEEEARRVFRRLSLVPGGSASAEIAGVLAGIEVREAEHQLDELVELSLLEPVAGGRVAFHDLVAVYAADRLAAEEAPEERTATVVALRSWLLATACNAGRLFEPHPADPSSSAGLHFDALDAAERWLVTEAANWTAALGDAAAAGDDRTVVDVAESMHWFSDRRARWPSWIDVFDWSAGAADRLGDVRLHAVHRNYLSWALSVHGRYDEAAAMADRAGTLARSAGDVREEAWALRYDADARAARQPEGTVAALERYRTAGELFEQVGDEEGWLTAISGVGRELARLGRVDEALEAFDRALSRIDQARSTTPRHILDWQRSAVLSARGRLLLAVGDLEGAESTTRAAVVAADALGVAAHQALTRLELGRVLRARRRPDESRAVLVEARAHFVSGQLVRRVTEVDAELAELG